MDNKICPKFEYAAKMLSKKWASLIIYQLLNGAKRFSDFQKDTTVSAKVLSERLKEFEKEGIINREIYPETPVRIEYSLTKKGTSLAPIIDALGEWSSTWL